jgi:HEAT repeat protein
MKMRVEEGKVIADITDTPLQVVLQELADRTGVIFEVRSQENSPVSIHLQHVSLQEAVQRITSGSNAIYLYGQGEESAKLKLVRIFARTPPVQQPALIYLGTGAVTKNNNTVETPDQALQVLASNATPEDREMAIEVLVKNKGEAAVKALTDCISDPAPEIRVAAIEGPAAMGARVALPGIIKSLKDSHPGVRQSAATAVALLGDAGNLKDLKPLTSDKDTSVATAAEVAIGKLSSSGKK